MADKTTQGVSVNVDTKAAPNAKTPWAGTCLESTYSTYSPEELNAIDKEFKKKIRESYEQRVVECEKPNAFNLLADKYLPAIVQSVSKRTKEQAAKPKERLVSTEELKNYLSSDNAERSGKIMIPKITGSTKGKDPKSAKVLSNGLVVMKYNTLEEFEKHLEKANKQSRKGNFLSGMTGKDANALASIVEIKDGTGEPLHAVVSNDGRGTRVKYLDKSSYNQLITKGLASGDSLTENQKVENRSKVNSKILDELLPPRVEINSKQKKFLLNECRNDLLFGMIPVPGRWGGRKDKLKNAMKKASFTFSDEDGVVVQRDKSPDTHRYFITVNGDSNEEIYIPLGNKCSVKIDGDGKIVPDCIYKTEDDGSKTEINISGGKFRLPLTMYGPLTKALKRDEEYSGYAQAKQAAKDIMEAYNKLELIVCSDLDKDREHVGMSFMASGKTHGMRLTDGEKIAATATAGALTVGLGLASGGLAIAGAAIAAGVCCALSAVSTAKGAYDVYDEDSLSKTASKIGSPGSDVYNPISENFSQTIVSNQSDRYR